MGASLSTKTAVTSWAAADQMHVLAVGNLDRRMTLEDLFTECVVSPVIKNSNGIDIDTTDGSDGDVDLLTCLVTGTPKLSWDNSEGELLASHPLRAIDHLSSVNGITRVQGQISLRSPLSNLQKGAADTAVIAVFGDSWVGGKSWTDPLRKMLQQYFGDAGPGYCAADEINDEPENIVRVTTGTWTDAASTHSLSLGQTTSTDIATPAKKTFASMSTTYIIHYLRQVGGGSFRYRIGEGSWTTVDTSHTSSVYATVSVATGSFASHTLSIEVTVAGDAGVTLFGVDCQSSANGVRLSTCAQNGKSAQNFAGLNATSLGTALTSLTPDAIWVMLGVNDMVGDRTVAQYEADLQTFVTLLSTAAPNAQITLVTQTDSGYAHTPPYSDYADGMRRVAYANGAHLIDLCTSLGPFVSGDPWGVYLSNHPTAQTGVLLAHLIYQGLGLFPANATLASNLAALSGRPGPGTGISQLKLIDGSVQATQPLLNLRNSSDTYGIYTVNTNSTQVTHVQQSTNATSQFTLHTFGSSTGVYLCTNDVQMVLFVNGAVRQRISPTGNIAIGDFTASEQFQVGNSLAVCNTGEGSTGRLTRRCARELVTLSGATKATTLNIPSGARLLAVQMCVNTAVTDDGGDDTWSAAFSGGSTTAIVSGAAAAKQTKVNLQIVDEITSGTTNITFTANGGSFSAGVIEVLVYYEELTPMANAA